MIGRNELTAILNTAWDAVNASKAGPILDTDEETGQPILKQIGYNTFLTVIGKTVPADVSMTGALSHSEEFKARSQ